MIFSAFGFLSQQGLDVEYLIVGGGAAGENANSPIYYGYGGGAGGYIAERALIKKATAYSVVVGLGGDNVTPAGTSSFAGRAASGGVGLRSGFPQYNENPDTGSYCGSPSVLHKVGGGGAAESGSSPYCATGSFPATGTGNNGGDGLQWYDGNYYAGGGGGGIRGAVEYVALGGLGGGGNGGWEFAAPSGGVANTGGGGGGGGAFGAGTIGASGGSGIVKVRYAGSGSQATGGTISYDGAYTYHTFTGSGTFTTL